MLLQELTFILILILVNGFFAASEMALVTSRRARLKTMADEGKSGAKTVLKIKERPGNYLAAVQVGITLVGSLASAVGGAAAVPVIAKALSSSPILSPYAGQLALILVVVTITYLSLVLGELVPKQMALRNPEALASMLIWPIQFLSRIAALPIKFLSLSTDLVLSLLGSKSAEGPSTSSEEIKLLIEQGTAEGIFQLSERSFVSGVFDYAERKAQDVMTARPEMVALDASLSPAEALNAAAKSNYSRFPIFEGDLDHVIGYVHLKDLIWAEEGIALKDIARQTIFIPAKASLPSIYKQLTQERIHLAIVLDEHGGTAGMLTLEDVLEVIVGEIDDEYQFTPSEIQQLGKNSWLMDGSTPVEQLNEVLGLGLDPSGVYSTLAGFVLTELGRMPVVGDSVSSNGYQMTVRKMDNLRIERVLVQKTAA